jgi:peptidyl-prolyl cis-trans isomerase SDCCAG10
MCLDGFYNGTLVHRILPDTLLQLGALRSASSENTNTSHPPEAVNLSTEQSRMAWQAYRAATQATTALERQRHELHSRLRFQHRGIVAMALPLAEDKISNMSDDDLWQQQPQFFITLDALPHLDGQHVIFGTVSGPTIFNALRMGNRSIEVDESTGQPLHWAEAPVFRSVKIVDNPLHQDTVVPQPTLPWRSTTATTTTSSNAAKLKKKKRKGKLDTNVLSFGDELEEDGAGISLIQRPAAKKSKPSQSTSLKNEKDKDTDDVQDNKDNQEIKSASMPVVQEKESVRNSTDSIRVPSQAIPPSSLSQENGTSAPKQGKKMSAIEARRAKYASAKKDKKNKRNNEDETLEKLLAFQGRVKETIGESRLENVGTAASGTTDNSLAARMARRANVDNQGSLQNEQAETYHGQVLEGKDDDVDVQGTSKWMATTFKCRKHMDHKAGSDGRTVEDYKVVDDQKEPSDKKRDKDSRHHHNRRHHNNHGHRHRHHDHHRRPHHSQEQQRHHKPEKEDDQKKPERIRGGGGGIDGTSSKRPPPPRHSFQGLFPKKQRRTEAPVETIVASTGFPISSKPKKFPKNDNDGGAIDNKGKAEKLLDWHETAHEVRRLGASAFVKQQKRDFQDEDYLRLTGRERKKQQVPLPIVLGIKKKQAQREAAALAEARAAGMVLPKQAKKEKKKESRDSRWNGPAPSIGFVKKGILQLKRKPT